jgi:tetratricopeptide (TPR) repeat protein
VFQSIVIRLVAAGWLLHSGIVPAAANGTVLSAYVGGTVCADCHAEEAKRWQGSHHDLAMQPADEGTVLGDFDNAKFTHYGVTSTFSRDGDRFLVRTEGADGKLHDYPIKYTFGVTPLQQYLVEFPDGRLQALGIAWDSRPAVQDGQRWFSLYPDEAIEPGDELHWTGLNQNWNFMCAECHSTNLKKNYDPESDSFNTTWSEIDVSCEACHGPGAAHVAWAGKDEAGRMADTTRGLVVALDERQGMTWSIDPVTGTAVRSKPRTGSKEIELCARCHARRGILSEDYVPGRPLMDTHRPALLSQGLYYPDGQIRDEVYVYGSFLQSRMYHAGVTCSDCHEPHSLELRSPGDEVCLGCHAAGRFATPKHHFHEPGSPGARCVACHMPARTYMVVDPRRDHSIRVPRPDQSVRLGTPNACLHCHGDRTDAWAAARVREWYGEPMKGFQDFAEALLAGRRRAPEAPGLLVELLGREDQPAIARATAAALLADYPIPQTIQAISNALYDPDPLVRLGGLEGLAALPANLQFRLAGHLLDDPVRAVRIEAGRLLAAAPDTALGAAERARLSDAIDEYIDSQLLNADRPQAQVNLGNLYTRMGRVAEAEAAYRQALALDERFVPAYVNLADLYRQTGREAEAQKTLKQGLAAVPGAASLHHAQGLARVRGKDLDAAVTALARAAELDPDNARYAYVHAVALDAAGNTAAAIDVLEEAYRRHPYDPEILAALASYARKAGDADRAERYAAQLDDLRSRQVKALGQPGETETVQ